jgi:hypothetical protein
MIDTIKNNFIGTVKCDIPTPCSSWNDDEWLEYHNKIKNYKNRLFK